MNGVQSITMDKKLIENMKLLNGRINDASSVFLATHESPDGDGLGAMISLALFLKERGKQLFMFSYDEPPDSLRFLPGSEDIKSALPAYNSFDLIIGLDYGDIERLHLQPSFLDSSIFVTIDHHISSRPFGDLQIIHPNLSSTSEIIYWFFRINKFPISKNIALNLLAGILVDTGGFSHVTTSSGVFGAASDLLRCGVVPSKVVQESIESQSNTGLKIWGRALSRIKEDKEIGMLYSYVLKEDLDEYDAKFDDVAGLISLLNTASVSRFSALLVEYEKGIIKGSLRSERFKGVDVSEIASKLGGGGHKYASGFTREGTIEDILGEIRQTVMDSR